MVKIGCLPGHPHVSIVYIVSPKVVDLGSLVVLFHRWDLLVP